MFVCEPLPGMRYCIERVLRIAGVQTIDSSGDPSVYLGPGNDRRPVTCLVDQSPAGAHGPGLIGRRLATDRIRRVVVYSAHHCEPVIGGALQAGASSFVSKAAPAQRLIDAVCDVRGPGNPRDDGHRRSVFLGRAARYWNRDRNECSPLQVLTVRESAVLMMIAEGTAPRAVAERLNIGERTVGNHVMAIRRRLDIARERFRPRAIEHGLIDPV